MSDQPLSDQPLSDQPLSDQPLGGRTAIVTGANHGIGAAAAIALAQRGADVAVAYLRSANDSNQDNSHHNNDDQGEYHTARGSDGSATREAIESLGRRCHTIEADLTDHRTPKRLFDETESQLGPVSVLVHNASGWQMDSYAPSQPDAVGRLSQIVDHESIDAQFLVDAKAGALLMAEFITRHRARQGDWGRIVTMTSGEGKAFPGEVSYGAAKAALISYTLSAAAEMAADGVTANVIYPPVTDTGWITDEVRAFVTGDTEHHHIASPSEVAEVIGWLCADAGRIVTGNIIRLR